MNGESDLLGYVAAAFCVVAVYFYFYFKRARLQRFAAVAKQRGWSYSKKASLRKYKDVNSIPRLTGIFMTIYNVVSGKKDGSEFMLFDRVAGSKNESWETNLLITSPKLKVPLFNMHPRAFRLRAIERKSAEFTDFPEFSELYFIEGNAKSLWSIVNQELVDYLSKNRRVSIEGYGNTIVIYRPIKTIKSGQINSVVEKGFEIFNLFIKSNSEK